MIDIPDSIFPKDENGETICPKCRKVLKACVCPSYDPARPKREEFILSVRLDKKGRKGKVVTLVQGLPRDEEILKDLAKLLKTRTGSGGTFYVDGENGVVEIQGDHWEMVRNMLREEGFGLC